MRRRSRRVRHATERLCPAPRDRGLDIRNCKLRRRHYNAAGWVLWLGIRRGDGLGRYGLHGRVARCAGLHCVFYIKEAGIGFGGRVGVVDGGGRYCVIDCGGTVCTRDLLKSCLDSIGPSAFHA